MLWRPCGAGRSFDNCHSQQYLTSDPDKVPDLPVPTIDQAAVKIILFEHLQTQLPEKVELD